MHPNVQAMVQLHLSLNKKWHAQWAAPCVPSKNNNILLANAGIIQWDRLWGGYIEVSLCNYLEDFLDLHTKESSQEKKAEDFQEDEYYSKGGYTSITDEVMYLLLGIRSVNVLRLALRALYTYEKDVNVKKRNRSLALLQRDQAYSTALYRLQTGYSPAGGQAQLHLQK
ncbi:hypothetical protein GCM10020331_071620 [Ectobacillus funiculus]